MRVIAGSARGRPLKAPPTEAVRPTGDKVKAAMFSLLEAVAYKRGFERIVDDDDRERFAAAQAWPRVLDLYAGSGALGIEALSRGAEWADFVESRPVARRVIEANLRATRLGDRANVLGLPAARVASTPGRSYDVILADPPYANPEAAGVLAGLASSERLAEHGVLLWEHHQELEPPPELGRLQLRRTRRHGVAAISLYSTAADD